MKTFNLSAVATISIYTKVEAKTLEEAIKIAEGRSIEKSDFDGRNSEYSWVSDDYDGELQNIREEA